MLRTARKWAKEKGKTLDDILMELAYSDSVANRDRLAAIKMHKEYTIARISEGGDTDKGLAPSVFLPEQHPRLKVVEGGKVE